AECVDAWGPRWSTKEGGGLGAKGLDIGLQRRRRRMVPGPRRFGVVIAPPRFGHSAEAVMAHGQEVKIQGRSAAFTLEALLKTLSGFVVAAQPVQDHAQRVMRVGAV